MKYSLVAFDLDDTLAVSKSPIEPPMASLLGTLLTRVEVCIISGGKFEQFDKQILQHLDIDEQAKRRLHLMPTCGTRYYRWAEDQTWRQIYAEDFDDHQKRRIIAVLTEGATALGLWPESPWGEVIEDRGSQITFSALGQSAPAAAKYEWDRDGSKKEALRAYAAERLTDLEVRGGGSTSVDITKRGVDKAYGMRRLSEHSQIPLDQMLFIGDRLDPGGNDYPVKAMGVECMAVHGWEDTAELVSRLLETTYSARDDEAVVAS